MPRNRKNANEEPLDLSLWAEVADHGFAITTRLLPDEVLADLAEELSSNVPAGTPVKRNILELDYIRDLAGRRCLLPLAEEVLGTKCFAVRGLYFDKTRDANWGVAWHQDLSIPVKRRIEVPGYTNWTTKGDVLHVQPPAKVLENMVAIRLHIDPSSEKNGAIRVLDGSHSLGRVRESVIASVAQTHQEYVCRVKAGGCLLLRPLLVHSSPKTLSESRRRRVIHIEYASTDLDGGLEWHTRIPIRRKPRTIAG